MPCAPTVFAPEAGFFGSALALYMATSETPKAQPSATALHLYSVLSANTNCVLRTCRLFGRTLRNVPQFLTFFIAQACDDGLVTP